jgi:putative ABC transport system permease protein
MESLIQDIRFGLRTLVRRRALTAVVLIALALGIGANTAIFSVVNGLLLNPLPYPEPDRLAMVWMNNTRMKIDEDIHSFPNYKDYKDQNQSFEQLAAYSPRSANLTGEGEPVRVMGVAGTSELLPMFGVRPHLGRNFTAEEDQPGASGVVLLGYGLWRGRFGADPEIVGKTVSLSGVPRTVIGVMPAGFAFPTKETEFWIPLAPPPQMAEARSSFWLNVAGRLKPGVSVERAQADMSAIAGRLAAQFPEDLEGYGANVVGLHDQVVGKIRPALLVLMGAVAFVLLIACANVANLLLASAAAREREIAIRTALGAGRWRLVRQLLTESVLLFLAGGTAGVLVAYWGLGVLMALSPPDLPRLDDVRMDGSVLAFTLCVSLLTGLLSGLVPALQTSVRGLNDSLKEGGRGATVGRGSGRMRDLLVVSEVALSLVLLIGAGLMIASFVELKRVDLGFDPDRLLTMQLQLPGTKYPEPPQVAAFSSDLLERAATAPGVRSVGAITTLFLSTTPNSTIFSIEGRPDPPPTERVEVPVDVISPNFFEVVRTPLLQGRSFTDADRDGTTPVVIVNETMAKRFWPGEDPVGKRMKYGIGDDDSTWMTIVGVVGDMRRTGFDESVRCETFLPLAQNPARRLTIVARATGEPASLAGTLREQVRAVDPDQPVFAVKTVDELLGDMVSQRRLTMLLFGVFAGLALLLAAVGIYGVMSYAVTQRTHEIGVRMALGAQVSDVLRMVVGKGMALALGGIAAGLAAAFALSRVMSSLLYGVSATDPLTFGGVALLLALVALVACYLPARRATRVEATIALRYE